jgi:hypothetical protein
MGRKNGKISSKLMRKFLLIECLIHSKTDDG